MGNNYNGVIPINSGDDSVVLECDHKSTSSIAAANGALQTGATITDEGVIVGAAGGVQFDMTGLSAVAKTQLAYTGQYSFTIDALHIGTPLAEYAESLGYAANVYFAHWNAADNVVLPYGRIWSQGVSDALAATVSSTDTVDGTQAIHEAIGSSNDGKITVTVSWNGAVTRVEANGHLLYEVARSDFASGLFEYLMTGALLSGVSPTEGATISDVILANRPVQYAAHRMLANSVWYGDSYVDQQGQTNMYNAGCVKTFDAYFRRIGFKCDSIEAGVSGALAWDGAANSVASQLDGTNATKPNLGLSDLSPRITMFRDLVNDVVILGTDLDQSIADRKGHIQDVLDRNSNNIVIVGTVPSQALNPTYDNDTVKGRVDYVNSLISGLPDAMTAIDAAYSGRVLIVDQFTAFGGHNPTVKLYQANNNHPSGFGQYLQGTLYAEQAVKALG